VLFLDILSLPSPFQSPVQSPVQTPVQHSVPQQVAAPEGVIFTLRRFEKRGGSKMRCPPTLDQLKKMASEKFNIVAFSFRSAKDEAEISDVSLISPDEIVWVLTQEEEAKFS